jgi:hypothetical protein
MEAEIAAADITTAASESDATVAPPAANRNPYRTWRRKGRARASRRPRLAEYGWVASPVKAGLRPPPPAANGLDRACHPAFVCHQAFDGKERLKPTQMPCQLFRVAMFCMDFDRHSHRRAPGRWHRARRTRRASSRCARARGDGELSCAFQWSRPSDREVLAGLVERVTYQNADNGFCVIRVKARGHRE